MLTLFAFGPAFGLPDPSPFAMKTEVQLKMAALPFTRERAAPPAAPKGKVPFIDDRGFKIGDSTFIRAHLEEVHGIDLDADLTPAQKALAWTVERMLEDHLYFAIVHARWLDDENFAKGPSHFFDGAPEGVREAARERTRANLHAHGLGRHAPDEIVTLAARDIDALAMLLGDKPYLTGDAPCGADATVFAFVAGVLTPYFDTPLRAAALKHANLVAYRDRMMERFYPEFERVAA